MESDHETQKNTQSGLFQKNAEIHAERLRKLKEQVTKSQMFVQIPNQSRNQPRPGQSKVDLFDNTISTKMKEQNYRSLHQTTFTKQVNSNPNKSKYFQTMKFRTIDSENKILFKKIERIVKGKRKSFTFHETPHKQKRVASTLENYDDKKPQQLHVTSDLVEDIMKNKAIRSEIKQQGIRQENFRLLQRLMTLKPTIQTRKILSQTKKSKDMSKKMSRFNHITSTEEREEPNQDESYLDPYFAKKRYSLGSRVNKSNEQSKEKYFLKDLELPAKKNTLPSQIKINTQPIQSMFQIKLPQISPNRASAVNSFKKLQVDGDDNSKQKSKSTNSKYFDEGSQKHPQNFTQYRVKPGLDEKKRTNSFYGVISNSENTTNKKTFQIQNLKRKSILLAQIVQTIEGQKTVFKFIRLEDSYEIQYDVAKQENQNKQSNKKTIRDSQEIKKSLSPNYTLLKVHSPKNLRAVSTKSSSEEKYFKKQRLKRKNMLKSGKIVLSQQIGSGLFSKFDYDYHRIIAQCLQIQKESGNKCTINLKQHYLSPQFHRMNTFSHESIRQDAQDEQDEESLYDIK